MIYSSWCDHIEWNICVINFCRLITLVECESIPGIFRCADAIIVTSPSLDQVFPIELFARQRYFKGCSVSVVKTTVSEDVSPFWVTVESDFKSVLSCNQLITGVGKPLASQERVTAAKPSLLRWAMYLWGWMKKTGFQRTTVTVGGKKKRIINPWGGRIRTLSVKKVLQCSAISRVKVVLKKRQSPGYNE